MISTIQIRPQPNLSSKTLEILTSVRGPTLAQPGCLACRLCVYEEEGTENAILFCEHWASLSAFHEHVRSELYRRVLGALELASSPPEVSIYHVSATQGMDLIREIRATTQPAEGT